MLLLALALRTNDEKMTTMSSMGIRSPLNGSPIGLLDWA
jgi:hypothetical protein